MTTRMYLKALVPVLALALAAPTAAWAMGGSGGASGASKTVAKCKKGYVWDKAHKKCVVPKQGMLDDQSVYEAGRDLAYAGRYDEAIAVLETATNKEDPRILNFLGYANRKSGRVNVGLGYYAEALRVDPDYTLAREYLGEAYIQIGDLGKARAQLLQIEQRKGKNCPEYRALSAGLKVAEKAG